MHDSLDYKVPESATVPLCSFSGQQKEDSSFTGSLVIVVLAAIIESSNGLGWKGPSEVI